MTERTAAIVLAGGRSSRFGRDKLVEPIDGRPMVDRAIDAVRALTSDIVVVVSPGAAPTIDRGVTIVHDERPFEGPLAGLATGLAVLASSVEHVVLVGGDMPSLMPAVLEQLISALARHDAAVLADETGPRPLPMAIRSSVAGPAVERLVAGGERRLRALIDELDAEVIPRSTWERDDPMGGTLVDVDTPADLPRAQNTRRPPLEDGGRRADRRS
jgi:molybdenum cofactor guanylyltransferase